MIKLNMKQKGIEEMKRNYYENEKFMMDDEKMNEECGVLGIMGNEDEDEMKEIGMNEIKNRGKEEEGIV